MLGDIMISYHGHVRDYCLLCFFLGLSQYALLHLGQTLGFSPLLRGTQVCPHRSHWYPSSFIFAISLNYLTSSI
jgi:hypothetical protein